MLEVLNLYYATCKNIEATIYDLRFTNKKQIKNTLIPLWNYSKTLLHIHLKKLESASEEILFHAKNELLNPFVPNAPSLYPLKTPESLAVRVYRKPTENLTVRVRVRVHWEQIG